MGVLSDDVLNTNSEFTDKSIELVKITPHQQTIANSETKKTAEIVKKLILPESETTMTTATQISVERQKIPPTKLEDHEMGVLLKGKSSEAIRSFLVFNLLKREPNMSPGRRYLLNAIDTYPGQLEKDLHRSGRMFIGDVELPKNLFLASDDEKADEMVIYNRVAQALEKNIFETLDFSPEKIKAWRKTDEILNSGVQTFRNSLLDQVVQANFFPEPPWSPSIDLEAPSEVRFTVENNWLSPDAIVVSTKKEFAYVDSEKAGNSTLEELKQLPRRSMILETEIRHNPNDPNDVKIIYKATLDGKEITWDPTKSDLKDLI